MEKVLAIGKALGILNALCIGKSLGWLCICRKKISLFKLVKISLECFFFFKNIVKHFMFLKYKRPVLFVSSVNCWFYIILSMWGITNSQLVCYNFFNILFVSDFNSFFNVLKLPFLVVFLFKFVVNVTGNHLPNLAGDSKKSGVSLFL